LKTIARIPLAPRAVGSDDERLFKNPGDDTRTLIQESYESVNAAVSPGSAVPTPVPAACSGRAERLGPELLVGDLHRIAPNLAGYRDTSSTGLNLGLHRRRYHLLLSKSVASPKA
jgi:hypothetical protein